MQTHTPIPDDQPVAHSRYEIDHTGDNLRFAAIKKGLTLGVLSVLSLLTGASLLLSNGNMTFFSQAGSSSPKMYNGGRIEADGKVKIGTTTYSFGSEKVTYTIWVNGSNKGEKTFSYSNGTFTGSFKNSMQSVTSIRVPGPQSVTAGWGDALVDKQVRCAIPYSADPHIWVFSGPPDGSKVLAIQALVRGKSESDLKNPLSNIRGALHYTYESSKKGIVLLNGVYRGEYTVYSVNPGRSPGFVNTLQVLDADCGSNTPPPPPNATATKTPTPTATPVGATKTPTATPLATATPVAVTSTKTPTPTTYVPVNTPTGVPSISCTGMTQPYSYDKTYLSMTLSQSNMINKYYDYSIEFYRNGGGSTGLNFTKYNWPYVTGTNNQPFLMREVVGTDMVASIRDGDYFLGKVKVSGSTAWVTNPNCKFVVTGFNPPTPTKTPTPYPVATGPGPDAIPNCIIASWITAPFANGNMNIGKFYVTSVKNESSTTGTPFTWVKVIRPNKTYVNWYYQTPKTSVEITSSMFSPDTEYQVQLGNSKEQYGTICFLRTPTSDPYTTEQPKPTGTF